jgi:hypothetical protein
MATFEREISGFRYAETRYGDDLRRVALREMGDASLWPDLVAINGLSAPYLTDDPAAVRPGVLLNGGQLLIPAPQTASGATEDPAEVFGIDMALDGGQFSFADGDLAMLSGWDNFLQSVRLRMQTQRRDLMFHPTHGSLVHTLKGRKAGATENALAAFYARSALLDDDRVSEVTSCIASIDGDTIRVVADIVGVGGKPYSVDVVI